MCVTFSNQGHSDEQPTCVIINIVGIFFSTWPFADFMNEMASSIAVASANLAHASKHTSPSHDVYCSLVERTAIPPTL